ncbi:MAG: hypothetical protein AB1762_15360 [Gemmatimonadota bacterium]
MSDALERALRRAGLRVRAETREGLLVLLPLERDAIPSDEARRKVLALAAEHGFSHVALELID